MNFSHSSLTDLHDTTEDMRHERLNLSSFSSSHANAVLEVVAMSPRNEWQNLSLYGEYEERTPPISRYTVVDGAGLLALQIMT